MKTNLIRFPRINYSVTSLPKGHVAPVRYFPMITPLYKGGVIDPHGEKALARFVGYALPAGYLATSPWVRPKVASAAVSFWQEFDAREKEWVAGFRELPKDKQLDYLQIFYGRGGPKDVFSKASLAIAGRLRTLANYDLSLVKELFWKINDRSRENLGGAVFYALGGRPLLQAGLLVAGGVQPGLRLLESVFEANALSDLGVARIMIQGKGLEAKEQSILQEINRRFFVPRGGAEKSLELRRLAVWQNRLSGAFRYEQLIIIKRNFGGRAGEKQAAKMEEKAASNWRQLTAGLSRFSAEELYNLLQYFTKDENSVLLLARFLDNGYVDRVRGFLEFVFDLNFDAKAVSAAEQSRWWKIQINRLFALSSDSRSEAEKGLIRQALTDVLPDRESEE